MVVEVHTAGRPSVSGRALSASVLLLLVACGLAAGMTWLRSGDPLGKRVSMPGWELSFQIPRRFEPYPAEAWTGPDVCRFVGVTQQGAMAELIVVRIEEIEDDDARWVAMRALELDRSHVSLVPWSEEVFGPFEGAEVLHPSGAVIIRAAIVSPGLAYAVLMQIPNAGIDQDAYHMFDLTCRSIELIEG